MTAIAVGADSLALRLVDAYRTHLSGRKGYRCAAGAAGGSTCSTAVRASLVDNGLLGSIVPAARQFGRCAQAAWTLRGEGPVGGGPMGGGPGMGGRGFGGFGGPMGRPPRRAGVQGVCCLGPIPIPFRF